MSKRVETVLCYIEKNHQYLMLLRNKKKNDYNQNKYIGVGGKIMKDESPLEALYREVKEETGLTLLNNKFRGKILFVMNKYEEMMYLYTSNDFNGELIECNEGSLSWIDFDKVMSLSLWEGDKAFLKLLINDEPYFEMTLRYQNDKLMEVIRTK